MEVIIVGIIDGLFGKKPQVNRAALEAVVRKLISELPPGANDTRALIGLSGNSARTQDAAQQK